MDAVPCQLCTIGDETAPKLSRAIAGVTHGRYLACSTHVLGEIRAGGVELAGPVELIQNWVAGELPPQRIKAFPDGSARLRVVTAVGVLIEHKGIDVLIEAVARLQVPDRDRLVVDLYGREDDDRFRTLAAARGVEDVIRFRGLLPQAQLLTNLREYDVFAFPTAWREPFAFAPLEAAATGCVPLISDGSGNAEWMVGGVHCLKAPRRSGAFAEVFAAILHGQIDLGPIARRAQAMVRSTFHLPALMPRIEASLEEAAAGRGGPGKTGLFKAAVSAADGLVKPRP